MSQMDRGKLEVGGWGGGGGRYLLSFAELLIQVGDLLPKTGKFWCRERGELSLGW